MNDLGKLLRVFFVILFFSFSQAISVFAQTGKGTADSVVNPDILKKKSSVGLTTGVQLEALTLLALGPSEGRAVLQFLDKKMHVVRLGDIVTGTHAKVVQVLTDKLVLEESSPGGQGKQLIWMFKGTAGGSGRVQRFTSTTPPTFVKQPPKEIAVPLTNGSAAGLNSRKKQ